MKKKTGIYIHIPFCKSKCVYCDFLSARPEDDDQIKRYISSLAEEIREKAERIPADLKTVDSVFFGGGTPTLLDAGELIFILEELGKGFEITEDAEITIECNPGMVGRTYCQEDETALKPGYNKGRAQQEEFEKLRAAGVNRISFGLQSASDRELKVLGRIHRFQDFKDTFAAARAAGFKNINADIISAIPGQTIESFRETLKQVTELEPEHISCYSLILEEGTRLFEHLDEFPPLPDEDMEREMYHLAREFLKAKGYEQYEISNFCRIVTKPEGSGLYGNPIAGNGNPCGNNTGCNRRSGDEEIREQGFVSESSGDYRCRHNLGYWDRAVYFGFGAGAASFDGRVRYKNVSDTEEYIKKTGSKEDISQREVLTKEDTMAEFMFLGMRKTKGVSGKVFFDSFGVTIDSVYGDILKAQVKQGLIEKTKEGYALTGKGTDVSNSVMAEYMF